VVRAEISLTAFRSSLRLAISLSFSSLLIPARLGCVESFVPAAPPGGVSSASAHSSNLGGLGTDGVDLDSGDDAVGFGIVGKVAVDRGTGDFFGGLGCGVDLEEEVFPFS